MLSQRSPGTGNEATDGKADTIVPGGVQGLDRYAYVNNNPVKYTDPSGHDAGCAGMDCSDYGKTNSYQVYYDQPSIKPPWFNTANSNQFYDKNAKKNSAYKKSNSYPNRVYQQSPSLSEAGQEKAFIRIIEPLVDIIGSMEPTTQENVVVYLHYSKDDNGNFLLPGITIENETSSVNIYTGEVVIKQRGYNYCVINGTTLISFDKLTKPGEFSQLEFPQPVSLPRENIWKATLYTFTMTKWIGFRQNYNFP